MIVVNKETRLISVPAKEGRLHFSPGSNEVDPVEWTFALKHPLVQHMVDFEMLKPHEITSLKDLRDAVAVKLVSETLKLDLLDKWLGEEEREPVKAALRAQRGKLLEAIKAAKGPK